MEPSLYQMIALKHGAKLYLNTGIKPNRLWTQKNMIATISRFTKRDYPQSRNGLKLAYHDITSLLEELK